MSFLSHAEIAHLLAIYGYPVVALMVGIEGTGIPVPGEATLIAASIVAGTTHELNIVLVVAAASGGAVLGDNAGFWIGRSLGYRLLRRLGPYIWLTERSIKLGQYLFTRYGGTLVFLGRFIALLRTLAPFVAGAVATLRALQRGGRLRVGDALWLRSLWAGQGSAPRDGSGRSASGRAGHRGGRGGLVVPAAERGEAGSRGRAR